VTNSMHIIVICHYFRKEMTVVTDGKMFLDLVYLSLPLSGSLTQIHQFLLQSIWYLCTIRKIKIQLPPRYIVIVRNETVFYFILNAIIYLFLIIHCVSKKRQ